MEVRLTPDLGQKLQRMIRHGTNPISTRHAEIILGSALGSSVDELSREYCVTPQYIEQLIADFKEKGMKAITAGARK